MTGTRISRRLAVVALTLVVALASNVAIASAAEPGLPRRVRIPKIRVNTAITNVGRASNGAMAVPRSAKAVAWFSLGTRPGAVGSAVFGGHAQWGRGSAVFARLGRLKRGDRIYVTDNAGKTFTFVVRKMRYYSPRADAQEIFTRADGRYLNLVTCTGTWNARLKTHNKRLVVTAVALP